MKTRCRLCRRLIAALDDEQFDDCGRDGCPFATKKEDLMTLPEVIMCHVRAEGPVTFASIMGWVSEQHQGEHEDYQVAAALTELIRKGELDLYDTGDAFVLPTPK